MESFPSDHPEPHSRTSSGKPAWLMVQDGQPWGAQLPCQSSSRGAGKGGSGVKAEPWASCDPQSPPVGKAGNTSLCLLNHAVHWRLGGNPVGLGILALGVKHYRGVVKIAAGRAHCAVFHLRLRGLNGLSRRGPRLQLQICIAGLSLLSSLTAALGRLWFLSSFDPSLNHPPGEQ